MVKLRNCFLSQYLEFQLLMNGKESLRSCHQACCGAHFLACRAWYCFELGKLRLIWYGLSCLSLDGSPLPIVCWSALASQVLEAVRGLSQWRAFCAAWSELSLFLVFHLSLMSFSSFPFRYRLVVSERCSTGSWMQLSRSFAYWPSLWAWARLLVLQIPSTPCFYDLNSIIVACMPRLNRGAREIAGHYFFLC